MTAVVMLGIGILYVVQYQDKLISAELDAMKAEAQLFAGAIAEGATQTQMRESFEQYQTIANDQIIPELAQRMVRRFSETKDINVRLYNTLGDLVADSSKLMGPSGAIQITKLAPPKKKLSINSYFENIATALLAHIPKRIKLPKHPNMNSFNALSFPDVISALQGITASTAWAHPTKELVFLSAAAPVQRVRQVTGVVYLTKPANDIERQVHDMQIEILKIFSIVFAMSIVFSLYLSGTMAGPLKRLAIAAEKIRNAKNRDIMIPDMSARKDEIGELSLALRDMTQSLWFRMDAIEGFAADVSHELKNPLTSLRSAVETARKIKDKDSLKTLMDIILHDVQRLDRLITDISKASRLDAELSKDEMGLIDVYKLFQHVRDVHQITKGEAQKDKNVDIGFDIGAGLDIQIRGNETRLMQVFDNLIANALSFSPKNGAIKIRIEPKKSFIKFLVEDQGSGIPDNKLETIFDRFYTERPQEEAYGNNSGLGLSIAKQIIEAHNGKIYAENIKDGDNVIGARFIVKLPKEE